MIIKPKPIKERRDQIQRTTGCRVERGLCTFIYFRNNHSVTADFIVISYQHLFPVKSNPYAFEACWKVAFPTNRNGLQEFLPLVPLLVAH